MVSGRWKGEREERDMCEDMKEEEEVVCEESRSIFFSLASPTPKKLLGDVYSESICIYIYVHI